MKGKKTKIGVLVICLVLILGIFGGCVSQEKPDENAEPKENHEETKEKENKSENKKHEETQTRLYTDSAGRQVELPKDIKKVAASGSVAQMMIYSVAPETLVGWSKKLGDKQKKYLDPRYSDLPVFGQFYGKNASLNIEALVVAAPDVIIDIGDKKSSVKEDMDAISEQTGIPTIFIEATIANYDEAYENLGEVLNREEEAKELAEYAAQTMKMAKEAKEKMKSDNFAKVRVFFGTGKTGLNCNAKGSIHATVIEEVGAENAIVVEKISNKGGGNTISMEQLIISNPDVFLLSDKEAYSQAYADTYWSTLQAVKNENVYFVPGEPYNFLASPPSINQLMGVRWLGNLLYPEYFSYDMKKEVQRYYNLFWHYNLSDEEANTLLKNSLRKQ